MGELEKRLQKSLSEMLDGGKYLSGREFMIQICESFDVLNGKSPMQQRQERAVREIVKAFIDCGWVHVPHTARYAVQSALMEDANQRYLANLSSQSEGGIGGKPLQWDSLNNKFFTEEKAEE